MKVTESTLKAIVATVGASHVDVCVSDSGIRILITKIDGGAFTLSSARNKVRNFRSMNHATDFLLSSGVRAFSVMNSRKVS